MVEQESFEQLWHDISWEDKHLFSNVTSTNYGNPVQAFYSVAPDGRPSRKYLTKAGLKHFGYEDEDKEEALEAEREAKRKPSKNDGGGSNSSSKSSERSSSSTSSDDNGSCVKFIFTIIPILPIWWLIKLFIKVGAASFVLIWWLIKAIFYIISWPIRILLYCCLDKEKRRFLPKWTFDIMPAYSFKKF